MVSNMDKESGKRNVRWKEESQINMKENINLTRKMEKEYLNGRVGMLTKVHM